MSDFHIKRGDQGPPIEAILHDPAGAAIDLSDAEAILFKMGRYVEGAVTVVEADAGSVQYLWDTDDTRRSGVFKAEFEIEWSDGRKQTVPNDGYLTVEITKDLD
jgi:hypothetical protein